MTHLYTVEKVLNNGWGLARSEEGEAVFIPEGLPGERFQVEQVAKRKGAKWAETHRRLDESSIRAAPCCPHFGDCGGCQLLHVARPRELDVKLDFLKDCLRRIGRMDPPDIEARDFPLEGSRIRGKFHTGRDGILGFKSEKSHRVHPISHCRVLPQSVRLLLPRLEALAKAGHFRGEVCFAADTDGLNPALEYVGRASTRFLPEIFLPAGAKGALLRDGPRRHSLGEPWVAFCWRGLKVRLRASQFFQSNPLSWPVFFEQVDGYLTRFNPSRVWDSHAGSGFLTSCLEGREVFCSEPDPLAWKVLQGALEERSFRYHGFHGTAEQAIERGHAALGRIDGMLLDPPRAGLSPELRSWLLTQGPASLLYFSCDMASFSRDLADLDSAYRLCPPIFAMNVNPGTLRLEMSATLERRRQAA